MKIVTMGSGQEKAETIYFENLSFQNEMLGIFVKEGGV